MSAECPNHVGNWKLFESPRSSMSSCHGHFSTSLPLRLGTLAWQDIKASVEYFDTFQRQPHGIPRHPPKLWAPAASLSSMTSMSSSDRILPHFGECLRRVLSIGICQGTAFRQILWASWVEASEAQVPPVPPVPGCSQSQFTEFTEFTVRVPQRNRSASFHHSIRSFRSPRSLLTPLTPLTPF